MPGFRVLFAVYGALVDGDPDNCQAADVTARLQSLLDASSDGVLHIGNVSMGGDPAYYEKKHFGALVEFLGQVRSFACEEGQTIDFS